MDYYHYISDSKVDMLFDQIQPDYPESVNAEVGFNIGVASGKLGGQKRDTPTRIGRVKAIERTLQDRGELSSDLRACTWLKARIDARIGSIATCSGLVLFGGRYKGATLILAGSDANLISGPSAEGNPAGWSFLPRLLSGIRDHIQADGDLLDIIAPDCVRPTELSEICIFGGLLDGSENIGSGHTMREVLQTFPEECLPGPVFSISFLARVFLVHKSSEGTLALGSPLYVRD